MYRLTFQWWATGYPPPYPDRWRTAPGRPQVLCFHALVPVPDAIVARPYRSPGGGGEWELEHWGCVSGARRGSVGDICGNLIYNFYGGPEPPIEMLVHASRFFPDLSFRLSWWEDDTRDNNTVLVQDGSIISIVW